jgi:hypothetical protein
MINEKDMKNADDFLNSKLPEKTLELLFSYDVVSYEDADEDGKFTSEISLEENDVIETMKELIADSIGHQDLKADLINHVEISIVKESRENCGDDRPIAQNPETGTIRYEESNWQMEHLNVEIKLKGLTLTTNDFIEIISEDIKENLTEYIKSNTKSSNFEGLELSDGSEIEITLKSKNLPKNTKKGLVI